MCELGYLVVWLVSTVAAASTLRNTAQTRWTPARGKAETGSHEAGPACSQGFGLRYWTSAQSQPWVTEAFPAGSAVVLGGSLGTFPRPLVEARKSLGSFSRSDWALLSSRF